jgi:hypothetical protein
MKLNILPLFLSGLALAAPTPTTDEVSDHAEIAKRATITDVSFILVFLLEEVS